MREGSSALSGLGSDAANLVSIAAHRARLIAGGDYEKIKPARSEAGNGSREHTTGIEARGMGARFRATKHGITG